MSTTKALELALEALEKATRYGAGGFEDAKDSIKQALAAPVQDEFPLRGILASELKCWHRLTEDEQINLLAFVKNTRPAAQPAPTVQQKSAHNPLWLATHPDMLATPPSQPAPVPLTDEQIDRIIKNAPRIDSGYVGWILDQRRVWARAIEAAHGITKGQP